MQTITTQDIFLLSEPEQYPMPESLKKLSLKQQNYLETIHDLCRHHGHTHVKSIADRLQISMPSVTEAVKGLAAKGLIKHDIRKNITLSQKGKNLASTLARRQLILADFYSKILGCPRAKADEIACRVEHVVDDSFCSRLAGFAEYLRKQAEQGDDIIANFKKHYENGT